MSNNRVVKSLYGSLLRLASKFDRKRPAKAMIFRPTNSEREFKSGSTLYFAAVIDKILGKSIFYHHSKMDMSFKALVRSEFRKSSLQVSPIDRINTAFAILRKFSSIWAQFEGTKSVAKRLAKDAKYKITVTSDIRSGVLLCSHPMINGPMQRAVVLLLEHNDEYSYGIIINKKTDHTLATATRNLPDDVLAAFGDCAVSFGGNVRRLQFLHPYPDCGGTEVAGGCSIPYYHSGNISKAIEKVKEDANSRENVHFFVGSCLWSAGALQEEVNEGTWLPVNGPTDLILRNALDQPIPESYATRANKSAPSTISDTFSGIDREYDSFEGQNEIWCKVLRSGGRNMAHFAALSPFLDVSSVEPAAWYYDDEEDEE